MKRKMPESHTTHPNVVPLIDIIMCLIIFFMLVAKIGVSSGEDESLKIPYGLLGKEIKSMDNTLVVNVKETNGSAEVSAMLDPKTGRENIILDGGGSGPKLGEVLAKLHTANKELKLVIRGDAAMTFGTLQKVLLSAAQAHITSLNFRQRKKKLPKADSMNIAKGSKQVHYDSGPDMTPLVDVVMVLLIFLMMVGKFGGANRYLESDMPISSAGASNEKVDPNLIPKEPVTISIIQPTPDAFRASNNGKINATDEKELAGQLGQLLAGLKGAGRTVDDIQVFIKPLKNVRYTHVIKVYTAAVEAGFTKIGFQTSDG